jgi:hypothetical protein
MPDEEREKIEERLLADEDLFYEVEDAENALVDSYVKNELSGEELARFEKSLERIPARRTKAANAAALREFISDERTDPKTITIAEKTGLFDGLRAVFRSPVFGYSMAGLFLIVSVAALLLLLENQRKDGEIARIQAELLNRQADNELERQLAESRTKEAELQTQIDSEKNVSGDLTADLERERENRRRLEAEIADLRNQKPDAPPVRQPERDPEPPTIAAITLKPTGSRGSGDVTFSLNRHSSVERVSVLLTLPANTGDNERLSVQLNGKTIAQNLKVRTEPNGTKTLAVTVAKSELKIGENKLTVTSGAKQIEEYDLTAEQE